jgi:hypothetical protein
VQNANYYFLCQSECSHTRTQVIFISSSGPSVPLVQMMLSHDSSKANKACRCLPAESWAHLDTSKQHGQTAPCSQQPVIFSTPCLRTVPFGFGTAVLAVSAPISSNSTACSDTAVLGVSAPLLSWTGPINSAAHHRGEKEG